MTKVKSILIIDDDDVSNFIYKRVIETTRTADKITTFIRAREALEYLEKTADSSPEDFPDIIFLDINMPVMNGWQFLEKYETSFQSKLKKRPVLCMLSSSVYQEDISKAYTYTDVKEYISKPLTSQIMTNLIQKHFS
ncbi:response regulator [Fulvivirga kasyanovii]|uniref:Response regulator n=1 Tax=Fulvivirga kasyanovii TaxID=396812 RepID=A0ABW9RRY6_9BACT|nr:response regulator [Fulvivirga kasyanovii]MTI26806.1 response regulator [Fulvivirga kasyanovii]